MVWVWLLVPLVTLALTSALWRAVTALGRERADLQSAADAIGPLAERARSVRRPETAGRTIGREPVHR